MSRGQSLYSEVQVEQVLSCLGEGSLYSEVQVEQVLSCLGEGSLYSEVQVEQVLSRLGEGLYTVRSKLNKFYHVWGRVSIQ